MNPLKILPDNSECLRYNIPDLPLYSRPGELYQFGYKAVCHWHPDLEFVYIIKGTMDYYVNGNIIRIHENEGFFVNSCRMHYGFSNEHNDCTFICAVIHPSVFTNASNVIKSYVKHKISSKNIDYILLSRDVPWQNKIIDRLITNHAEINSTNPSIMQLLENAAAICTNIFDHIDDVELTEKSVRMQLDFLKMTEFIHKNYQQKITLDDIASAGTVSRSKCCRLFKQFVQQAPNIYLTKYRISQSIKLLSDSDLPITDIALSCGFQTASYYTNVFKQDMNITPLQYRKNLSEKTTE